MRTTLAKILRKILGRVREDKGATYLIRRDFIEITTKKAVRAELGIPPDRPLLPLVGDTLTNDPIAESFPRLAHQSGYNIVVDPRIADKLQTPATVEFNNMPVDTAVRMLANMAGMSEVQLDNVLYVTTAENAKHLREEQAQVNAETIVKTRTPVDTRSIRVNSSPLKGKNGHFLPSKDDLQWPPALQREAYKEARKNLNVLMKAAYKSMIDGNAPSDANLRDLRSNLRRIQDTLRANVGQLTPDEYIDAERYLRDIESTITALKDTNSEPSKKPTPKKPAK